MTFRLDDAGVLLWGPLLQRSGGLPITFSASLPDLRTRFIAKAAPGRGQRAIARNGRVLLTSNAPLPDLVQQLVRVRFQPWHKVILPGEAAALYGLLMCVRLAKAGADVSYAGQLVESAGGASELLVAVGGGTLLEFVQKG